MSLSAFRWVLHTKSHAPFVAVASAVPGFASLLGVVETVVQAGSAVLSKRRLG